MDANKTVYQRGSVYIEDDRIVEVGDEVETPNSPEQIIDATHKVVLPGFVNSHAHLQQYFRGVYELIGDFYKVNLPLEGYRQPEDMEWFGPASCAELIHGGCTTSMIIYTYPDGFAKSIVQARNRVLLAADIEEVDLVKLMEGVYEYIPKKGEAAYKRAVSLYEKWQGAANGRITTIMAPKAADLARPETYLKCKEYADKYGLKLTTHLSQSWREVQQVKRLYGKTPPEHLRYLGILDKKLTGAHCTYATETDTGLIANSGMGILHCRAITNPLLRWLDTGIPIGLGTDDYFHDMLQLLRENIIGQQTRARAIGGSGGMLSANRLTARPSYYELLELATRKGAETLGIHENVGSLEPGKKADIITIDMQNPYLKPTKDVITSIVLYGTSSDIDNVIVDGEVLKTRGRLTTIDLPEALKKAQERVEYIIERFFEDYPCQRRNWERKSHG